MSSQDKMKEIAMDQKDINQYNEEIYLNTEVNKHDVIHKIGYKDKRSKLYQINKLSLQ